MSTAKVTYDQVTARAMVGLKPLPALKALLHFLIAGFAVRFSFYNVNPWLQSQGLTAPEAFIVSAIVPMALLFAAAFASAASEGIPETAAAFADRFRLRRLRRRDLGWIGLGLLATVGTAALSPVRDWMISLSPALAPPASFPVMLNPQLQGPELVAVIHQWLGSAGGGTWRYALLFPLVYFFNTFGEELYWRGILLPRQELVHGRWTWVAHGLMWAAFHVPVYPWYAIYILPLSLGLSYVAQRSGNTWVSIVVHALQNLFMYGMLIGASLGAV